MSGENSEQLSHLCDRMDLTGGPDACWEWSGAGPDACWEWSGARKESGYGVVSVYELTHGPIPTGMLVCHRCDNPPCCNPEHLFLGTYADNNRDAAEKGRTRGGSKVSGERHPRAKLTDTAVGEIARRVAAGEVQRQLAAEYGVSASLINNIALGKRRVAA